jgi:hypothetical protein
MRAYAVFVPALFCSLLRAQPSAWNVVETLPPGTRIVVTTNRTIHCTLGGVDDSWLYCDSYVASIPIPRSRINKIGLLRPHKAAVLGALIGAGAGGALAGVSGSNETGEAKTVQVLAASALSGVVGYGIGHLFGLSSSHTIYVHP